MTAAAQSGRDVFGLRGLLAAEGFERLGYCGTQLLMLLYLADLFGRAPPASNPLYAQAAAVFGVLEPTAMATQVVAIFLAATQLAALAGAGVARLVDERVVVAAGGCLMAAGHFAMAEPALVFPALALLVAGAGCTIGNKLAQFGALLARRGADRARGYAGYAMAVNVGALLAPLVCGTLAERTAWAWGFRAAGVSMILGLLCYLAVWRGLPSGAVAAPRAVRGAGREPHRGRRIAAILLMLLPYVLLLAVVNQAYTLAMLWASTHVARDVAGFTVPITWVLAVDGILSIAGLVVARRIWRWRERRGRPLSDTARLAVGCLLLAGAYALLSAVSALPLPGLALFVLFFVLLDLATGWIDPPVEAFASAHAPAADAGLMMGAVKASGVVAALLLGWMGRWFAALGAPAFWALNAAVALGALAVLLLLGPIVARLLGHVPSRATGSGGERRPVRPREASGQP